MILRNIDNLIVRPLFQVLLIDQRLDRLVDIRNVRLEARLRLRPREELDRLVDELGDGEGLGLGRLHDPNNCRLREKKRKKELTS